MISSAHFQTFHISVAFQCHCRSVQVTFEINLVSVLINDSDQVKL